MARQVAPLAVSSCVGSISSRKPSRVCREGCIRFARAYRFGRRMGLAGPTQGEERMSIQFRQRLLATTLLVGSSVFASPAFAQDEPEGPGVQTAESIPAEEASTGDIVVTGTLIKNPNLVS